MIARARLYSMRQSARKVRIVLDLIRGKSVDEAHRILSFTPRRTAEPVLKLLHSAVANARQKGEHLKDPLYVSRTFADQGAGLFRKFEAKAMLRSGVMKTPLCHVTIELDVIGGKN